MLVTKSVFKLVFVLSNYQTCTFPLNQLFDVVVFQVKFHPTKPASLATGSTDGLVCVFDISQSSEEDALVTTLNSESSVVSRQTDRQTDSPPANTQTEDCLKHCSYWNIIHIQTNFIEQLKDTGHQW